MTDDHKTVSSLDDEKYGGYGIGVYFDKVQIETKLAYEFKRPIKINDLIAHGMRIGRKTVMKEEGRRPELFKFIEKYEANDKNLDENYGQESGSDINKKESYGAERETTVKQRVNQTEFRKKLMRKYNRCCLCAVSNSELLNASHIKPWKESDGLEKLEVGNGLLLCPNHDRLFDGGFISFDNAGQILISEELSDVDKIFMNVNENMHIDLDEDMKKNMEFHRKNIFRK